MKNVPRLLAVLVLLGGVGLTVLPIVSVIRRDPGYHPVDAQLAAVGALALITAALLIPIRKQQVAKAKITWKDVEGQDHTIQPNWLVPATVAVEHKDSVEKRSVSALRALYRGKDNRASTSKSVALAWTYAIGYGLLALLALKLMGDSKAWDTVTGPDSLQEEYLLLLGGPYAAAIIAKYAAVATVAGDAKTSEPRANPSPGNDVKNLIADDQGDTDLGDFQYVLFNLVALLFFLGTLTSDPRAAFPDLPPLLVGLTLTSAATYTAKKAAISAAGPQLVSVFPTTVRVGDLLDLFGRSLVHDGNAPMISLDGLKVSDVSVVETAGTGDHIKFKVPTGLAAASDYRVRVTTANGVAAQTAGGVDFLTVTAAPAAS
jgi:hypothetical protein